MKIFKKQKPFERFKNQSSKQHFSSLLIKYQSNANKKHGKLLKTQLANQK